MGRNEFTVSFSCSHCRAQGAVTWEENATANPRGPERILRALHGDFHAEQGRTQSGDPVIVCNACDTIQAD